MDEQKEPQVGVDEVEIEPLSDESLDTVAGGLRDADADGSSSGCCSCLACS